MITRIKFKDAHVAAHTVQAGNALSPFRNQYSSTHAHTKMPAAATADVKHLADHGNSVGSDANTRARARSGQLMMLDVSAVISTPKRHDGLTFQCADKHRSPRGKCFYVKSALNDRGFFVSVYPESHKENRKKV